MNCGRHETRHLESIAISAESCSFPFAAQAARLNTTVEQATGAISHNSYLLITSVEQTRMGALAMLKQRRAYWGIEGGLHAPLDVSALEDKSRVRLRNNAEVLALMRRATLSLSNAWKMTAPVRQANLPGFFEAARRVAIDLLTQDSHHCVIFLSG